MQDHLRPWALRLNKLGKGPLGDAFKHLRQVVLKKKNFEYFSMYFYGLKLGPLAWGHLELWDVHLNKIGIGLLGNATYPISSI